MTLAPSLALALDPYTLGRAVMGRHWVDGPHLRLLSDALVRVAYETDGRLIITMPPRHSKSTMASRFTPAWYLASNPRNRVILTAYEADFAAQWGRAVRDILEAHESELGVRLRQDSKAANRWNIEGHGGGMQTAGAGGAITGKGADLLLIDDPIKNDEEAMSQRMRDKVWGWWLSTALTRLEPGASVVLMMTRWHEDDLAGRLIDEGGWRVLNLPAIAEDDDPLGRAPGDALWPQRYDAAALQERERRIGHYWWAAMYQGRPQPAGGGLFKRHYFRTYGMETAMLKRPSGQDQEVEYYLLKSPLGVKRVAVADCWRFATVDLAASTKTSADYTVVACWAVTPDNDQVLLDVYRGRYEGPDQVPLLRSAHDRWQLGYLGAESVAYQLTLIQAARRDGLPIRELKADKDKVSRALSAAARYEAGQVYHPEHAHWLGEWEDELLAFPNGAHDDQVDVAAYAAIEVARGAFAEPQHGPSIW